MTDYSNLPAGEFLKCDAPGCDHIESHGVLVAEMIDKPCPKCGANLLTREDYDNFEIIRAANKDSWVGDDYDGPTQAVAYNNHGDVLTITVVGWLGKRRA
jgi:hypothetical protein